MFPLYLDMSEFLTNPLRTGIQRVEREIIRYWPGPKPLVLCSFDASSDKFRRLPDDAINAVCSETAPFFDPEKPVFLDHQKAADFIETDDLTSSFFNPELFFDPRRANAYRTLAQHQAADVAWLIYDFLPFLEPQYFPSGTTLYCMPYVHAMQAISRACFISEKTRSEFIKRVIKDETKAGPVFPLGGDGLQMSKQSFTESNKTFVYIGTIEPRKNVSDIVAAFQWLWQQEIDVRLTVVGRMVSESVQELPIFERLKGESRFTYLGHADDEAVRKALQSARATIFVSSAEGFGIPPYESLAASIPIIASTSVPSLYLLPPGGRIVLEEISSRAIAAAVTRMLDDRVARALWHEAAQMPVPTWKEFVQSLAAWLHEPQ